eukprot:365100-Chlamydomonas_euryale.AAC.7
MEAQKQAGSGGKEGAKAGSGREVEEKLRYGCWAALREDFARCEAHRSQQGLGEGGGHSRTRRSSGCEGEKKWLRRKWSD